MKYVLLGNGKIKPSKSFADADCVVQFNHCRHIDRVPPAAQRWVFLSNTGSPMQRNVEILCAMPDHPALQDAVMMQARNPAFYRLKRAWLRLRLSPHWQDFTPSDAGAALAAFWSVKTMNFGASLGLDRLLRARGMAAHMMPSTGMIAFDWVRAQMRPEDLLRIEGFGWQGWEGHPWAIERAMMQAFLARQRGYRST